MVQMIHMQQNQIQTMISKNESNHTKNSAQMHETSSSLIGLKNSSKGGKIPRD